MRYYILKNPAIWLVASILAHNFARFEIGGEMSTILLFTVDYVQEKLMNKIFQNSKKPYFWLLLPKFGQKMDFPRKKVCQIFKYSNYLPSRQKSQKLVYHSW